MFSADLVNEKGNIPRREQNYLRIKEDKKVQLAT